MPDQYPRHHPSTYQVQPDFMALKETVYKQLEQKPPGWHYLDSVGEWKPHKKLTDKDVGQERQYIGSAIQARPDNPSMLGVLMCPGGYSLSYGSPCGYVVTKQLGFSNLAPLICYVHSLHVPPPAINFRDPNRTITLDVGDSPHNAPQWRITDDAYGVSESLFKLIFVGSSFSRMTTVFAEQKEADWIIFKDLYPALHHRHRENELFDALQDKPCGWLLRKPPIRDNISFQQPPKLDFGTLVVHRERHRLAQQSTRKPFDQCESLSEAVGVIYDVLEGGVILISIAFPYTHDLAASRWAIDKRRVLHRDISSGNILIHPKPDSSPEAESGVCFIQGVYERYVSEPFFPFLNL
jgi:hypothetical protein